jgi:hypothetical protein
MVCCKRTDKKAMVTIKKLFGGSLIMILTLLVLGTAYGRGEPLLLAGAPPSFGQAAGGTLKGEVTGVFAASGQALANLEVRPDPLVAEQVGAAQSHIAGAYQTGFDLQNFQAGNKKLITLENFHAQGIINAPFNPAKALAIVVPGYSYGMDSAAIWQNGIIDTASRAVEMAQEIQRYGNEPNVLIWDWAAGLNPYEQTQANAYDSAHDLAFLLYPYLAAHPIHGQIQFIGDNLGALVAWRGVNFQETFTHDLYYFQYVHSSGDYYPGWFYGTSLGLYEGSSWDVEEAGGGIGFYTITGMGLAQGDAAKDGWVYVDSYYDWGTDGIYTPLSYAQGLPAGRASLGSESDFIIQANVPDYAFGVGPDGKILEADLFAWYDFTFTFESGDYYTGMVLAGPDYGYYPGLTWNTTDEHGGTGTYEINDVYYYVEDNSGLGEVLLYDYYDAQSAMFFTTVNTLGGTEYLGKESGYILTDKVAQYRFGRGYEEADLVTGRINAFRFTYANGDYYTGTMYADPATLTYYHGYTQTALDENGELGAYEITAVTPGTAKDAKNYGKVLVSVYFDAESGNTYKTTSGAKPVGTDYLGSEMGYIVKSGVSYLQFGDVYGIHQEADVAAQYAFTFSFGNGDYYQGTVYGLGGDYLKGDKIFQDDETTPQSGKQGYYEITGVGYLGYSNKMGQVTLTNYYDVESNKAYKPLSKGKAAGTYLGGESDYIIKKGVEKYHFGGGFYEADAL